jgi:hypothetical protein
MVNKFSGQIGGTMKLVENPYESITTKSIAPNMRELTYVAGGKEISWQHAILSGDDKRCAW